MQWNWGIRSRWELLHGEGDTKTLTEILALARVAQPLAEIPDGIVSHKDYPSAALHLALCNDAGFHQGALLLLPNNHCDPGVLPKARSVARCLVDYLTLSSDLEAMTDELTERYEELNLVYHTEDQVNVFKEGRVALEHLVHNCCEYLDVGMSVLILRDKRITAIQTNRTHEIPNEQVMVEKLKGAAYDWIISTSSELVINDLADERCHRLIEGIPYKVLGCPIIASNGDASGVLVTLNHYSKPDFSNSDKNLLLVMARKAAKIVQANYDSLTGLINRMGFEFLLETGLQETKSSEDEQCVLHLDIDQMQVVNDTLGLDVGDRVIAHVSKVAQKSLRESDTLARLGGDNFGALLPKCSLEDGERIAKKVVASIENSVFPQAEDSLKITVSIGVAILGAASDNALSVMSAAEVACDVAKEAGRNRAQTYHHSDLELVQRQQQMHWVARIQKALAEDDFVLYAQPIAATNLNDDANHHEILIRMMDEDGSICPPGAFLPAAERYHLMPAIDRWVFSHTLETLARLPKHVLDKQVFAINLSGQTFGDRDFLDFVYQNLDANTVPTSSICFEVTETAAVKDLEKAAAFIEALRDRGCSFALDDFGSGLSSFAYLKSLPVDYLKIDGSFVKDINTDKVSAEMVRAIHQIGTSMGLKTIAEFVENDAIIDVLVEMGIDYMQGYGIGKPVPINDVINKFMTKPVLG